MSPQPLWPIGLIDVHQQKQVWYLAEALVGQTLSCSLLSQQIMYDRGSQVLAKT
jgi:hypothetical protein